jgi:membrane-associated phospholipid phosphatase
MVGVRALAAGALAAVAESPLVQGQGPQKARRPVIADQATRIRKRVAGSDESVNRPFLAVGISAALAVAVIAVVVAANPYIPADAAIERDVQSISWYPLSLVFPFFSWIGDAKGAVAEAILFIAVLIFNRQAWRLVIACGMTGIWYQVLSHLILRPRPTTAQVLRVTEHPGASSFPSGHTIFVATLAALLMLCFGNRFLPKWARPAGWVLVVMTAIACAISRVYTGTHWPTDVLAGLLITIAWIALVLSVRWISAGPLKEVG